MSHVFGPIRQLGYVVSDIANEMDHWIKVAGIGPWFYVENFLVPEFKYDGRPHAPLEVSAAFSNSGDLQIELIQQRSNTPSMFTEFLGQGREGLQHWAAWPDNYDEVYERAIASGYRVGQEGKTARGRFVYFRAGSRNAEAVELSEAPADGGGFRKMVRDAAIDWDGKDAIRRL
jgi:Glyoxalase/Bleomycin resistance protein/Dioxygenase superfamily